MIREEVTGHHAGASGATRRARPTLSISAAKPGLRWLRTALGGAWLLASLLAALPSAATPGLTVEQLINDPKLTPEGLIRHFADFKFLLGETVQSPAEFLARQAGDCDDFATLAAEVLKRRGYTPHLVVIHMERDIHVVCYVDEIKGFLDYNHRADSDPIVRSDGSLKDIGQKVAGYFRARWHTASEFTYDQGRPKYLATAFH